MEKREDKLKWQERKSCRGAEKVNENNKEL